MRNLTVLIIAFCFLRAGTGCSPVEQSPSTVQHVESIPTRDTIERPADIYLPPGYFSEKNRRYPVLYMLDGQYLFTPDSIVEGMYFWGLDTLMDQLILSGEAEPVLIVGLHSTWRRMIEFMPNKGFEHWPDSIRERFMRGYAEPEGDRFLQVLVEDVKPYIDSSFRTLPDQGNTYIGGTVAGGIMALYAISEHPGVFGGAICMSTHWPMSPRNLFPGAANATLEALCNNLPDPGSHKIYFDHGTEGMESFYGPYQQRVDSFMVARGYEASVNWMTHSFPGEEGTMENWVNRFHIPLKFMWSGKGE